MNPIVLILIALGSIAMNMYFSVLFREWVKRKAYAGFSRTRKGKLAKGHSILNRFFLVYLFFAPETRHGRARIVVYWLYWGHTAAYVLLTLAFTIVPEPMGLLWSRMTLGFHFINVVFWFAARIDR